MIASKISEAPMNSCQTPTTSTNWPISYLAFRNALIAAFLLCATAILPSQSALAQVPFGQAASLPVTEEIGLPYFGTSVAVSSDGNTVIVGGPNDNSGIGAVWVFTRSGNGWIQQAKLTPTDASGAADAIGEAEFGYSVALSNDGNTAIVGGPGDSQFAGAVWRFTQSGGVWTSQGKLTVNNEIGMAAFGWSVALSADDGNTAIIAGFSDKSGPGAVWFFSWSGSTWTPPGGTKFSGRVVSVAMSGDGNTAIVGPGNGGAWVYTQSGGAWTKQSPELTGNPASTVSGQGASVALSDDGNTAIIGGPQDSNYLGAAWVFTRNQGAWSTQSQKLVGSGAVIPGHVGQGSSAALSADGNTALVGGPEDNSQVGASWAWTRDSAGNWSQLGNKLFSSNVSPGGPFCFQGGAVALSADGGTAVVGGPGTGAECNIGSAYVYMRPAITISATPSTIVAGQSTMLTWWTTDLVPSSPSCLATGWWNGNKVTSSTPNMQSVTPPSVATDLYPYTFAYTLTCGVLGGGDTSNTAFVTVTAAPTIPVNISFCNLACVKLLLGAAGTAKPYGQAATAPDGVLVLTRSGSVDEMDVRHEHDRDVTTITASPDSTVIVVGDLGDDVRIVKASADPSKFLDRLRTGAFGSAPWMKLAAGNPDSNTKIVGAAFRKGTLTGLVAVGGKTP
jgi:hypothetical protein